MLHWRTVMAVSSAIPLYDQGTAGRHGGRMAGTAYSNPRGAEISERSNELVLPDAIPLPSGKSMSSPAQRTAKRTETDDGGKPRPALVSVQEPREFGVSDSKITTRSTQESESGSGARTDPRGIALPGDRGPRNQEGEAQRPSFWRRIALGRRTPETTAQSAPPPGRAEAEPAGFASRVANAVAPTSRAARAPANLPNNSPNNSPNNTADTTAIEMRIVEPMLQALVSVEAKLERSHTELVGRSDQVEQRLTQLWDIEEQLGTLSELQESLLQVSEQQRRLESAVISQTKTLRWLVGAVFFTLGATAFAVAAVLR